MNYGQIITDVCQLVGKSDPASITIAQKAARKWTQQIWNSYDWRQSLLLYYQNVPVNTPVLYLSPVIERIDKTRINTNLVLRPQELGTWMQIEPSLFESAGGTYGLSELPPIGTSTVTPGEKLVLTLSNVLDAGQFAFVRGDQAGLEISETVTLGTSPVTTVNTYDAIFEVTTSNTKLGNVQLTSSVTATALGTIQSYETERTYLRLQLMGAQGATSATTALVLGKRKCPIIYSDSQGLPLRNMDLALRQLIEFDLWCNIRQKADAAGSQTLCATLVQTMQDLELQQSGIQKQIIPDPGSGYGFGCDGGYGADHFDALGTVPYY